MELCEHLLKYEYSTLLNYGTMAHRATIEEDWKYSYFTFDGLTATHMSFDELIEFLKKGKHNG